MCFTYIRDFEKITLFYMDTFLAICKDILSCQL